MKRNKTLKKSGPGARWLTLCRQGNDHLSAFAGVPALSGRIAAQFVLGGHNRREAAISMPGVANHPLMWIKGDSCSGRHIAGAQSLVVTGYPVRCIELDGDVVGSIWSDADAEYCCIAGLLPDNHGSSRAAQTRSLFKRIERVLEQADMTFLNVVRTWFFLDHLLDWYDEFNKERTTFFRKRGVFDHLVPASTGIGASGRKGFALMAGALAMRPRCKSVKIAEVGSPMQCSPSDYRSSFSRAVEVEYPDRRQLIISGTASIAPGGETSHPGDVGSQIALTMEVVEAILKSRGMGWEHSTRGLAYFNDIKDAPLLEKYCRDHNLPALPTGLPHANVRDRQAIGREQAGLPALPLIAVHATVCRSDLLFELELDAEKTKK